jgi:hypothetical protein
VTTIRVAKRDRFTAIDRRTINDDQLSFRARGILIWLLDKPDDWVCDSTRLAQQATEGRDAVRTALKELEAAGYLERLKSRDDKGHWVTEWVIHETPPDDWKSGVGQSGVGKPGAITEDSVLTTETETPLPPSEGSVEVVPEWEVFFDAFWDFYPRKVGKPAAKRAMKAKYIHENRHAMADGIKAWGYYWARANTEEQFIPHPSTFLNQERYNDPAPSVIIPKHESAADIINRIRNRDNP